MNKNTQASEISPSTSKSKSPASRYAKKKVRIIKKIRTEEGVWKFVSLDKVNNKYVWDTREGSYFLEWYDGKKKCRELAGQTPSEALDAQRRKRNEIIGELVAGGRKFKPEEEEGPAIQIFSHWFSIMGGKSGMSRANFRPSSRLKTSRSFGSICRNSNTTCAIFQCLTKSN